MRDQRIECVDCGRVFTWTAGEQHFYRQRGLSPPKRCADCRQSKTAARASLGLGGPVARYGFLAFAAASALALLLWSALGGQMALVSWLVAVNLTTVCAFVYDKLAAKLNAMRVPERALLLLATAGGSAGALLAMLAVRHKTSKAGFQLRLLGVVSVQAVGVGLYFLLRGQGLVRRG